MATSFANYTDSELEQLALNFFDGEVRDLTDEQYAEYYKAEEESEGFDVPYYPHLNVSGMTVPIRNLDRRKEELHRYGGLAIQLYNEQNDTKFEIVEFEKVNTAPVAGSLYFMTFKAKPSGTAADYPTTTFQARVYAGIGETEVSFCRQKVPSS